MIWLIFAAMTGFAVFSVLWPLSRSRRIAAANLPNISLYEAQVAEIDRDGASGLIPAEDVLAAKADAARRLLAVSAAAVQVQPANQRNSRLAALAAIVLIPTLTLGLYSRFGRPDLPDAPLAARLQSGDPGKMDLAAAIVRIEAHLREHPEDGRGWDVIAPVYLRLGREEARRAFANAIRLLGASAAREAGLGEAILADAQGVVTAEARQAFEKASAADPTLPQARYYLGLAALQDGKPDEARAIWTKLVDEASADAPWVAALRQRIASLSNPPVAGPNSAAGNSIAGLPPAERAAAIRSMVEGLSARLQQNGGGVDEWKRLVRAYSVLHEVEKARAALADARKNLSSDASANAELDRLARELGLEG
jgi:cytochrome c-type biogenesis protein CcmH